MRSGMAAGHHRPHGTALRRERSEWSAPGPHYREKSQTQPQTITPIKASTISSQTQFETMRKPRSELRP
jgi:hypothetical protein